MTRRSADSARLHLASSSLRRIEILTALGVAFDARGVDIDETPLAGEKVRDMVLRLAVAKAEKAAESTYSIILGADTAVALQDHIYGKPKSMGDALDMLSDLSGKTHRVLSAVAVISNGQLFKDMSETEVTFREISADEGRRYWQSGEPEGKAGAYAIQGLGGAFVKSICGSYSGVVGLPVYETTKLLERAGIQLLPAPSGKESQSA